MLPRTWSARWPSLSLDERKRARTWVTNVTFSHEDQMATLSDFVGIVMHASALPPGIESTSNADMLTTSLNSQRLG